MNTCFAFSLLVGFGIFFVYHIATRQPISPSCAARCAEYGPASKWRVISKDGKTLAQISADGQSWVTNSNHCEGNYFPRDFGADVTGAETAAKEELARQQRRSLPDGVLRQS